MYMGARRIASEMGISTRHLFKILEVEEAPTWEINRKVFMVRTDFEKWLIGRKPKKLGRKKRNSLDIR